MKLNWSLLQIASPPKKWGFWTSGTASLTLPWLTESSVWVYGMERGAQQLRQQIISQHSQNFNPSWNHRIVWVGRDLKNPLVLTPLHGHVKHSSIYLFLINTHFSERNKAWFYKLAENKNPKFYILIISLTLRAAEHSVIPTSSLVKEWLPLWGSTWSWPRAGLARSSQLHDWGQREMLSSWIRSYPFSSHQPWKFTSQPRLKRFQHRENWWGQCIAGFITGLDIP